MSLSIVVPDVSKITKAVHEQLSACPSLADVPVERSADRNMDPNACPWIGIYRLTVQYAQRVLGYGGGIRDQRTRLLLLIQASDQSSGEACEEALEALVKEVVGALLSDTTLRGTVGTIEEFDVDYAAYEREGNVFMQTAALQFVAVGNTTASQ
jgi:hypothetical protein